MRNVVVTGGGQGIGMAVSAAFAALGDRVWVADVDAEAAEEHAATLRGRGWEAQAARLDVADEASVRALMERVDRVDVLINNAGILDTRPLEERPMEAWHRVLAVNLTGPYLCVRHALPRMPAGSAVVNIASTRALMSEPHTEPYSASKGGLVALTHSLAVSLGSRGIRVNAVSPGWIDVSAWKKASRRHPEILTAADHAQHPAGRVGKPEDVAEACLFLADGDRAGFITGTNLVVDGGLTVKMIYQETASDGGKGGE